MPPPLPASRRQVEAWLAAGHITPEQAANLRNWSRPPAAPPSGFWGPTPDSRDATPGAIGLAGAVVASALAIVADTLLASKTRLDPGDLLAWMPAALAVLAGVAAALTAGRTRSTWLT